MNRGDTMGYRIVYGADRSMDVDRQRSASLRTMIAISFCFFALLVKFFWPEGREVLMGYLLPNKQTVALIAFSEMIENLQQGAIMSEALTVFCKEILYEIA